MQVVRKVQRADCYFVRIPFRADLSKSLATFCADRGIRLARITGLGAVMRARIAYYDQKDKRYHEQALDKPLELVSLIGNVSIKDGLPFVHAHVVLADRGGNSWGGHLLEGTELFAGEFVIETFHGEDLVRQPDSETGLSLWSDSDKNRT